MISRLLLFLCLLKVDFVYSQNAKLNTEIDNLKNDLSLKNAAWSIYVINNKTSAVIAEYNSNLSLVPASTLKIATTGAALGILGADFVFETKLAYDGSFDATTGFLNGNLYITGGGDPTLESQYFNNKNDASTLVEKWAIILKNKGIKKIEGAIVGDASMFETNATPPEWIWGDIGNYYGAAASGLSYMDNKFTINFSSSALGSATTINSIDPPIQDLQLINKVTASGKTDSAFIYGAPYTYYRIADGTIPPYQKNYEVEAAMPDPTLFCAQALQGALKKNGIIVSEKATTVRILNDLTKYTNKKRTTLYTNTSPSLDKIVYWTNFKSLNLYAEHLLKYLSYKKTGLGKEADGTAIVIDYWKKKGVDISGLYMQDGCGLARANTITTKTQAQLLQTIAADNTFTAIYNSLPVAGNPGHLATFGNGTFAANNLRAKSGYLTRVRGYTGYVKNKKGELLSFAVLANNYTCTPVEMKKKLEKLLTAIATTE
ncbi:MAG: D-alanyl-D-alanine carboxypeptidase/D-alanyl-D-alanine-endopeptidase [Bacteroidia bacterium]